MRKSIYQLARASRQIPRIIARNAKRLASKKGMTENDTKRCFAAIHAASFAKGVLEETLKSRRIGLPPLRSTTPGSRKPYGPTKWGRYGETWGKPSLAAAA